MRKKTWATVHDLDRIGELFDRGRHAFPLSEWEIQASPCGSWDIAWHQNFPA